MTGVGLPLGPVSSLRKASLRASSIDADAWATRLIPPGDAEEELPSS